MLRDIATDNANVAFGLAANKIAAFTFYQGKNITKKATHLTSATNTPAYQVDDFIVRTI